MYTLNSWMRKSGQKHQSLEVSKIREKSKKNIEKFWSSIK
jgi:hypothetical protein